MVKKNIIKNLLILSLILLSLISAAFAAQDYSYSKLTETLLNQNPDPVQPGEYVELRFKIEKEGNEELKNIEYELIPKYPFSFDESDKPIKNLGNWIGTSDDKEYYTLYYKLKVDKNALEGVYELEMYQTSSNTPGKKKIEFDIRVDEDKSAKLLLGKVETSPTKLIANYDEGLIKVEIVNIGDQAAKQVIVDLTIPEGFEESFGYSTRANLGTIEAGESKIAEFYLNTNEGLVNGNKQATLNIQYTESENKKKDEIKKQNQNFNISIFARPEYKITQFEQPELIPGKKTDLKIKVQNIGSGKSDSTSIQIFKDSSQPFDFTDKSDFIGKMDVNEEGEVIFEIEIDENAQPKEYKLKLQIRSVVDGNVLTEDESININIKDTKNSTPAENTLLRVGLYAIFLIIGSISGYRFGLRKKEK